MGQVRQPKYDNETVTLGYLKKFLEQKGITDEIDLSVVSKNYSSPPVPPYHKDSLLFYDNKIYRCTQNRLVGGFNWNDWILVEDSEELSNFIETIYKTDKLQIEQQIDGKMESFYQDDDPSTKWVTAIEKERHVGDYWYNTIDNTQWRYNKITSTPITYKWKQVNIPSTVYDMIDSKKSIYTSKPASYKKDDLWIIEKSISDDDLPTGTDENPIEKGDWVFALSDSNFFNKNDWVKKDEKVDVEYLKTHYYTTELIDEKFEVVDSNIIAEITKSKENILLEVASDYTTKQTFTETVNDYDQQIGIINNTITTYGEDISALNIEKDRINATVASVETKTNELSTSISNKELDINELETKLEDIIKTNKEITGGNDLYLTDALESNAIEYFVEGKSEQETRSGKNLYNVEIDETTNGGITYSLKNNILKLNGTRTTGSNLGTSKSITYKANKTYTCTVKILKGSLNFSSKWGSQITFGTVNGSAKYITLYDVQNNSNKQLSITFTPTVDTITDLKFWFGYEESWTEKTFNNLEASIQVEEGSTATEFEEYGVSPSPDYPSEIKTIPSIRNLFDINSEYTKNGSNTTYFVSGNDLTVEGTWYVGQVLNVKPNTKYAFDFKKTGGNISIYTINLQTNLRIFNESGIWNSGNNTQVAVLFTTGGNGSSSLKTTFSDISIIESEVSHEYVPYGTWKKIKIIGKNLFDKNNIISGKILVRSSGKTSSAENYSISDYIPIKAGVTYYLSGSNTWYSVYYDKNYKYIGPFDNTSRVFTPSQDGYLRTSFLLTDLDKVQVEKGNTPTEVEEYKEKEVLIDLQGNELCSLGNVKDELIITDEKVVIDKKIGKVVLNGTEVWQVSSYTNDKILSVYNNDIYNIEYNNHQMLCDKFNYMRYPDNNAIKEYVSDTGSALRLGVEKSKLETTDVAGLKKWLSENNVTIYYVLAEPQQIILENANIHLFDGVNNITLVEDLETTTSIKYYRKTAISGDYVVQQQLDKTNNNLANTTDLTNQNASDINTTNTNLNNNYLTKDQVEAELGTQKNDIELIKQQQTQLIQTSSSIQASVSEIINSGVRTIKNTMVTIDIEGIKVATNLDKFSSLLNNKGLFLYGYGYEVARFTNEGSELDNLTVRNYLTAGYHRTEKYTDVNGKKWTAEFWVGD